MILQSLENLYERLIADGNYGVPHMGFSVQKVAFRVVIDEEGQLFEIQDVRDHEGKMPRPKPMMVLGEAKPPGSGINPCSLWDNSKYMLGYCPEKERETQAKRTKHSFEAFRKRHVELEPEISSKAFSAVCRFLENWDPVLGVGYPLLEELSAGFGVFQIVGETNFVHDDEAVRDWWLAQRGTTKEIDATQCLITGQMAPIARTHPKVKGVLGAQSSGASLVSFNESAYESYGKKQSANAPVSERSAFRYAAALNALTTGPKSSKHRMQLGDSTVVFWTSRPTRTEDLFATFITDGSAALDTTELQDAGLHQKLQIFVRALKKGREAYGEIGDDLQSTDFYILGLSPNAARVSIRLFHRSRLGELLDNLRRHFADISVARRSFGARKESDPELPPLWLLLAQTARESKEIPPILVGPLLRSVITGARYPDGLFMAVMRRIRADRRVNYARACVIKGYLTRNLRQEVTMGLDLTRQDPAYRLGRLFALMEKTQSDALGTVGSSIRDRFYGAASATPRSVFPRLLRTYQHHLAKLDGGWKINRERQVQEVMGPLVEFPAHLNLAEQGVFAIGYYHQVQDLYTKKPKAESIDENNA